MKMDSKMTDEALLRLLGERLSGIRLARNLTQQHLAEQAGLGLRTVQRLELGAAATQLSGFIRVCRARGIHHRGSAGRSETLAGVCGGSQALRRMAEQDSENPPANFPQSMTLNESI
ncbi:MAG: helix-turn-helix domain-containing protein, partial [Akkermansiaceae bacterium]